MAKAVGVHPKKGTYLDGDTAYAYLAESRKILPKEIVLQGESLGCAIALEMATRHPAAALILESPFTSTLDMAKRVFPWLPVKWIVRYRYDNLSKIPKLRVPLLILHSPQDEIVPFAMGKALYEAAPEPKHLFKLSGGHNDGYQLLRKAYVQAIASFLKGISHD